MSSQVAQRRTGPAPGAGQPRDVDALRGFALFGMLVVTISSFGAPHVVVVLFVELTFLLLFAFLLGYSGGGRVRHLIRPRTALILAGGLIAAVAAMVGALSFADGPTPLPGPVRVQVPLALALFLVGLAAGGRRLLAHARLLSLAQVIGFRVGVAGAVASALLSPLPALALTVPTALFLAAACGATLLRFFRTAAGAGLADALAPAGRMALSNYLGQSVVLALLFTGFSLGTLLSTLVGGGLFAGQIVVSAWWLGRHSCGPVEWLLRRPRWDV
ncbi:uncharacterized protein DUF418 [Asanoa ferruginea]|uniref:Uncharacterized protein DUF418 n=1 Tax=Asanoa ferruginea TaxID=53367 RepID=A0A3D9ZSB4_9ACTN|nr:DUF418 domain-containing protein [Asanoa ferruginea]REG00132.1 uncharacterized protein DUF418 [Asanoa ferruginea]GIF46173.1 hypothetical protein Afe04nite_07120 [Asanoa ferruginea]